MSPKRWRSRSVGCVHSKEPKRKSVECRNYSSLHSSRSPKPRHSMSPKRQRSQSSECLHSKEQKWKSERRSFSHSPSKSPEWRQHRKDANIVSSKAKGSSKSEHKNRRSHSRDRIKSPKLRNSTSPKS